MQSFFTPMLDLARSRKFYVALAGVVVSYFTTKFGQNAELTLFTGLLTALGVYGVPNEQ